MTSAAKLSITLPAKRAATIRNAVKSGDYKSADDVVNSALKLWEERRAAEIDYLRNAWKEGIESGPSEPWNLQEFLSEARVRKAKAKNAKVKKMRA